MISSTDAQVPSPDLPLDRPVDLLRERPTDLPPGPDVARDLGPDRLPDILPDLPRDLRRDLPPDLPPYSLPDRPRDLPPDLVSDLRRDLPPDRLPDLPRERFRDLPPEVPSQGDALCPPGSTQSCTCDNGLLGTRICLANLSYSECGCGTEALMRVKTGIIGTWTGTVTTPFWPTYHATITFDSYSHYAAKAAPDGNGVSALYYGDDGDSPDRRYDITDIQANGDAKGTIDVCFDVSGCNNLSSMEAIKLSADLSRLSFYIMYRYESGPLQYDLTRVNP